MGGVSIRTESNGRTLFICQAVREEIGCGMCDTRLTADPLAVLTLIVVTVEGQTIAVRTERVALGIIAPFQTSKRILVTVAMNDADRAQGTEVVVDKEQNLIIAFCGVPQHLCDVEAWKATCKVA
jgi:hypothetical protein